MYDSTTEVHVIGSLSWGKWGCEIVFFWLSNWTCYNFTNHRTLLSPNNTPVS